MGITGGIGSGKSAVTALLETWGIDIVDADQVARVVVQTGKPALEKIALRFGANILLADGTLDRAALRTRVFSNDEDRKWLEQLTHPLIGEEIHEQLNSSDSPYTVLSSPLLLETQQKKLVDYIVVVDVPVDVQIERTTGRDNNDEAQVRRIINAQMKREDKLAQADMIIDNSKSLGALELAVAELHAKLLLKSAAHPA